MQRNEVPERNKWRIEDIYPDDEAWEKQYDWAMTHMDFAKYAGKLGDKAQLLEFMRANDNYMKVCERLAVYAHMKHDEDTRISKYTAYTGKIQMLFGKYSGEIAYVEPELAQQSEEYLTSLLSDEKFSDYDYQIK